MKKRYLRMGIRFDDLRGMTLNELGHLFTHEFDENVYLVDVRDDITSGYTFYLLESSVFKEIEEGAAVPVIFAKQKSEYCSDGEYETFWAVEDYSEHVEKFDVQDVQTDLVIPGGYFINYNTINPRKGFSAIERLENLNHVNGILDKYIIKNEKEIEQAALDSIVYGTGIWDCGVSNSTTAVQLYNPTTGNFDEYEAPENNEFLGIQKFLESETKKERICCGAIPKWVDNGIGFQYHLCKTCGKEVE